MDRLTKRDKQENLIACGVRITGNKCASRKQYAVELAKTVEKYEDTGLSPADIADLKNEHCLLCGQYKTAHEGSCDGCRWKEN